VTTTTISPFVVSGIEKVELADGKGGKKVSWKKEILPAGKRKYEGEELDFSLINPAVVQAFTDKAVDSVPLVLALSDNKHPETGEELEYLEGDLDKLEMSQDGRLYGYFDLTQKVIDKIEASNKKLGVSCRIDVGYERKDVGKRYPYALRHVCATTAAHIKGMDPWEKVELSEGEKGNKTLDLSTEVIEETANTTKETGDDLVAVEIPKDQLDKLLGFLSDMEKGEEVANKLGNDGGNGGDAPTTTATLSEADQKRIDLAEQAAKAANDRIELAEKKAAKAEWKAKEAELAAAGVPPVMLTEAGKVLGLHKSVVIKLSDTESVDPRAVIESILEHAKGIVDLSEEKGHSVSGDAEGEDDPEFKGFLSSFGLSN
jgi:hypothetical protein